MRVGCDCAMLTGVLVSAGIMRRETDDQYGRYCTV